MQDAARRRADRDPALFLQERAADEIQERLAEVNRTFTTPAIVTAFPQLWRDWLPGARVVADDEVLALDAGAAALSWELGGYAFDLYKPAPREAPPPGVLERGQPVQPPLRAWRVPAAGSAPRG